MASAMRYLLDNPEKNIEMGKNGRRAILEYLNWSSGEKN